ncbi:cupredoxin family copper-binding protein [Rhodanobacter sp. FDAARGOS 1247]|jgi:plastocyanin|uniref:cupredoxin domain-containing protein n=1 Tax=Rhodanobacter sp. FDAARGOS 1247 TaxID=2778082 RepID=UPI0019501D42|nr:cupredoxin family copper-binding protein [Rhodanobacter sp. FDAARGOS 1247]QRP64955.1 cupredoxin family copper-binding protein [Rhodanobacter sp. FDAARGOS 1247]
MSRLACAMCLLLALGGGAAIAAEVTANHAATKQIEIRNFMFAPNTLTVPAGSRVTWINRDEEPHTVVSANGQFAPSKALDSNDRYVTTFSKPGTYVYYCTVHPFMTGTVVVK